MPKVTILVPNVKEGGESYNRAGRMSALYQKYAKKCAGTEGVVTSVVMPTIAAKHGSKKGDATHLMDCIQCLVRADKVIVAHDVAGDAECQIILKVAEYLNVPIIEEAKLFPESVPSGTDFKGLAQRENA